MADNVWAKIVILSVLCNFTLTGQKVLSADNIENERLNNNEQIEDIQGNFTKKVLKQQLQVQPAVEFIIIQKELLIN